MLCHFCFRQLQCGLRTGVIPSEMGQFLTVRLKNQLFGPKQVSYTPLGASGPFLTLKSHFWVKIGNFGFLGLSGTQNFK